MTAAERGTVGIGLFVEVGVEEADELIVQRRRQRIAQRDLVRDVGRIGAEAGTGCLDGRGFGGGDGESDGVGAGKVEQDMVEDCAADDGAKKRGRAVGGSHWDGVAGTRDEWESSTKDSSVAYVERETREAGRRGKSRRRRAKFTSSSDLGPSSAHVRLMRVDQVAADT
jgi:hypothetical protein